jgi:hypothetical protein
VTLAGDIQCPAWGGPYDRVNWVWVDATHSTDGWASLSGTGRVKKYSRHLNNVPLGGDRVEVRYGCSASGPHRTSFTVYRPNVGSTATRNIY